ncbi:hypothetical protein LJC33_03660 [Eubacteriales bacterium OttesenSCG-928-N13]|nr:hypothetical protein [Eubacteriales bacterium OttesenSCG-928-N13]
MQISKSKLLIKAVAFLLIFLLLMRGAAFVTVSAMARPRLTMHEWYEMDEPLDVAFFGSSRFYRSINSLELGPMMGKNAFGFTSSDQSLRDTYFLLREMYKKSSPELVVIDVSWNRLYDEDDAAASSMIWDYFAPSRNKLDFFFASFEPSHYADVLFPALRYTDSYDDHLLSRATLNNVIKKLTPAYWNYDPSITNSSLARYMGRGFDAATSSISMDSAGDVNVNENWDPLQLGDEQLEYLQRSVELCQQYGTKVVLLGAPIPLMKLASVEDYDDYDRYMQTLAQQLGVDFYDFAMLRPSVLTLDNSCFYDYKHANEHGAALLQPVLAQFLSEYLQGDLDESKYLCESRLEMLQGHDEVLSVWLKDNEGDPTRVTAYTSAAPGVQVEFEFLISTPANKEYTVMQPYGADAQFDMSPWQDGNYKVMVHARAKGSDAAYEQYFEVAYRKGARTDD